MTNPRDMIEELVSLAGIVRKQGPLGLECQDVSDPFLA
jgi:chemotaxis protein MotA